MIPKTSLWRKLESGTVIEQISVQMKANISLKAFRKPFKDAVHVYETKKHYSLFAPFE